MLGPRGPRVAPLPPARLDPARLGPARPGLARPRDGSARLGISRPGAARLGLAWLSPAWLGSAWPGGHFRNGRNISPSACSPRGGGSRRFSGQTNASSTKFACNLLAGARPCGPRPAHPPQTVWFPRGGKHSVLGARGPRVAPRPTARPDSSRLGPTWPGLLRPRDGSARLGQARPGTAWHLLALLGASRVGLARP